MSIQTKITLIIFALQGASALIGYDCGGQYLNVTSISLLQTGDCDIKLKTINSTNTYVQLLQLSNYNYAQVYQCKLEIDRTIYYCGMHSHASVVFNGKMKYLEEVGAETCKQMHLEGKASIGIGATIRGIRPNSTTARSVMLAGTTNINGECEGVSYSDPYGSWANVFVPATVTITLKSGFVPVHLESGKVILNSGATCPLADGSCMDQDNGNTYWTTMPMTTCDFHQYDVLYEGLATKTQPEDDDRKTPIVYSLVTDDTTFALATLKPQQICGYTLLKTEHPRLFILETSKENAPKRKSSVAVENLDIFTYVNSKFVYVEKHIRNQITSLYHNAIHQRCELEKEVIKNTLSLAKLLPDEFAYRLMKGPGYMSVIAGEAVHVVRCVPVDVTIRRTEDCYIELPITVRNASLYLTPKSRIITKHGTQRECSSELPTLYNIEGTWIQLTPGFQQRQIPPQQLQPLTKVTWTYLTPGSLATSGIYSKQDIEKLRDHIMFPAEKPALLNSMARGMNGYPAGVHSAAMYNLLDEGALEKIAESAANKVWRGFVNFGSATAGIFGIFIIIRLIKIIIDTAIHGYALHLAYGCSLHLIGAVWSSLTHLLLHLAHPPARRSKDKKQSTEGKEDNQETRIDLDQVVPSASAPQCVTTPVNASRPYENLLQCIKDNERNPSLASDVRSFSKGDM